MKDPTPTRRDLLTAGGLAAVAAAIGMGTGSSQARPPSVPLPPIPGNIPPQPQPPVTSPLDFQSPMLRPFVDELPILPTQPAGGQLSARGVQHRYHRDLPRTRALGYGPHINGPTLEAQSGESVVCRFSNDIDGHPLAADVDTTMMGVSNRDRHQPRIVVHLHGAPTRPEYDGHPMISWRTGGVAEHHFANAQEAATLWYHDHAMGITRLNVQAGLAGFYLIRDEFDTGRPGNPIGLPAGEREITLNITDRTFNSDGSLQVRQFNFLPQGMNQGGQWGDVGVINGAAWPHHNVARGMYRLRLLLGANSRTFRLAFSNRMRFWVIGSDQGLLDRPQRVRALTLTPGERADVLVDFGELAAGETVELHNTAPNSIGNALFMVPRLTRLMRFQAHGNRLRGRESGTSGVPTLLRGGRRLPPTLTKPVAPQRKRTMTLMWALNGAHSLPLPVRAMLLINNLAFMSDDVDEVQAGTVEQWDIVNVLPIEHPIHLHLATFRVIGRQKLNSAAYMAANPPPVEVDQRWSPAPDRFVFGPRTPPQPWERGLKDTVHCPEDSVTSILVSWPSAEQLGFDPDAVIRVPRGAELTTMSHGATSTVAQPLTQPRQVHEGHDHGAGVRGYVWHCHNLDHEDHDMMQRIRVRS